jgi:DNA-binding response OmpR family regulator
MDLRKAKVLMVDDNPQSLELLAQTLRGFRVARAATCPSAAEARQLLTAEPFDLIILDGEMPGEDGLSLTRDIRRRRDDPNCTTPILLVSGHTPVAKVLKARDAGANFVVKKPIAPDVLLSRIEWLARNTREFVESAGYSGPDRRLRNLPLPDGQSERRAETLALLEEPERAMSQGEIDSLFG